MRDPEAPAEGAITDAASPLVPRAERERRFAAGARFSHYEIAGFIGAGGMGEVYLATDLQLQRQVAVKVVHPGASPRARARLVREAQAMAKLTHRNVVTVFEVDVSGDEVMLIMEHVVGMTLTRWLRERARSRREIVDVFIGAGRGLAAAHRAGLVHRDFKPDNVFVGADGRVRVGDFGLAAAAEGDNATEATERSAALPASALAGTPAYMAPEQHLRRPVDARADQFAFCVSLYEALYGARPFAGDSYAELHDNVVAGRLRDPPRRGAPAHLRRLLRTGLAADPGARLPSLDAVIDVLQTDARARARRAAAAVAVVGAAGLVAMTWLRGGEPPPCRAAAHALDGVWDAPRKETVRRALVATGRGHAPDTYQRVAAILDEYAAAWTAMRVEACEATAVRHQQPPALLDLRMGCLDRRRAELAALANILTAPDDALVDKAVVAAGTLPAVSGCADVAALSALVPPPEDRIVRLRVAAVQPQIDALEALHAAGRYQAGLAPAQMVAAEALALPYAELQAEALELRSKYEGTNRAAREATSRQLVTVATRAQDDVRVARAWIAIAAIIERDRARAAEVAPTRLALEAALQRVDDPPRLRASVLQNRADALDEQARYPEAGVAISQVVALLRAAQPPDELSLAKAFVTTADLAEVDGKLEQALRGYQEARAIWERRLGPEHPDVASGLYNEAGCLHGMGKYAEAMAVVERALAIEERSLGPNSPRLARTLVLQGEFFHAESKNDEALVPLQRALAIYERADDGNGLRTAAQLSGDALAAKGDIDAAERMYALALRVAEEKLGPDHPGVASVLSARGAALRRARRWAEARPYLERALAIRTKVFGPDSLNLVHTLMQLGSLESEQDHFAAALVYTQRSLAIADKVLADDNRQKAALLHAVATDLMDLGRHAEAVVHLERAQQIQDRALPPDSRDRVPVLLGLAEAQLGVGRPADAVAPAERALVIGEGKRPAWEMARVRSALARALWDSGGDRARATDLVRRAWAAYAADPESNTRRMAKLRVWMAARHL